MFLREKRDGTIKARGCAYGFPQRLYTQMRPTLSIEAMIYSCTGKKRRYIVVSDIQRTFHYVDMNHNIYTLMMGTIADTITKLDPTLNRKHIWCKNKETIIYVQL